MTVYVTCLIAMYRGPLIKIPCYQLMFYNGIVDVMDLIVGSFIAAYFHFRGAVFCSDPVIGQIAGHLVWSVWNGASFDCVILALNRAVEMLPITRRIRFIFKEGNFQLFLQSLFICASTTAASLLYVYMNFFESPRYVVIGANVVWQMSHGVHGFVYISMNREIRKEILVLFYRGSYTSSSVEKLNTTQQAANAHTSKTYANRTNAFATNSCSDQQSGR
ncbi:hypothetical protein Y032_0016g3018 [Ancylostoma ceylanicum]|nr:hypothetical protein Y032_0016g3018 [Ancylostoma ceylanicum]